MNRSGKFHVSAGRDPRGLPVIACCEDEVGTISDMWVDEPEQLVRYLEVELPDGGKRLLPMTLARIWGGRVLVHSINAQQFPGVPKHKSQNQVTKLEEDQISAYYCGGKLYADPARQDAQIG
jgi:photosynthetic reaction center H subunit